MGQSHRAELSRLRSMMTGQGQSVDEIASAIRARYGYSLRAAYRHAMGWTLDQAAERYNHAADDADARLSGPRLSEWENWPQTGTRRPTAFNLLILSKVYSTHPTRLVTHDEEQRLDHRDRALLRHLNESKPAVHDTAATTVRATAASPTDTAHPNDDEDLPADAWLAVPWTAAGTLQALRVVTDSEPMTKPSMGRRQFFILAGATATAPAHEWLIARPADDAARPGRTPLPADVLNHLDTITTGLRRMDDEIGGATLLEMVRAQLHYVIDLIKNFRYSESSGRRLYATAAELLRLAGWTCSETANHALAHRYWVAALHAAHTAGDRALGANILGFMSLQAVDLGQSRKSVTLAETARTGYPGASPRVATLLNLRAAEAYALDGAATECRRALDAAFDGLNDAAPSSGEPDWSYWLGEANTHGIAGRCYLRLHDWSHARSHLSHSLRLLDDGFLRDSTVTRIRLAETYLHEDESDLDQALALATQATETLSAVNSAHCVKHLTPLIAGLAKFQQRPAVRDFTERAAALLPAS